MIEQTTTLRHSPRASLARRANVTLGFMALVAFLTMDTDAIFRSIASGAIGFFASAVLMRGQSRAKSPPTRHNSDEALDDQDSIR